MALEAELPVVWPKPEPSHRYRLPSESTDIATDAMQAYLDWEYGLAEQLGRDQPWLLRDLIRNRNLFGCAVSFCSSWTCGASWIVGRMRVFL
jgi:hypothetical protein